MKSKGKDYHLKIDGVMEERIKEYLKCYPFQAKSDMIRSAILDFIVSDDARQAVRNANKIYDEMRQKMTQIEEKISQHLDYLNKEVLDLQQSFYIENQQRKILVDRLEKITAALVDTDKFATKEELLIRQHNKLKAEGKVVVGYDPKVPTNLMIPKRKT